jgi:hypothetical protein
MKRRSHVLGPSRNDVDAALAAMSAGELREGVRKMFLELDS